MNRRKNFRNAAPVWAAFTLVILWLAAIGASCYEEGMTLFDLLLPFSKALEHPFDIHWRPQTLKFMGIALVLYGMGIGLYYSTSENRRPGEEYGSAKWGSPKELNKRYRDPKPQNPNVILTQNVKISMDGYYHQRNLNILVVGGSGSGKTRAFCKPGVMSANCSYLITDPKGELLRSTGQFLLNQGYEIKVFDLIHPEQSDHYNPFHYVRTEKDALTLIDNFIKNTTPKGSSNPDPFWESATRSLAVESQRTNNKIPLFG